MDKQQTNALGNVVAALAIALFFLSFSILRYVAPLGLPSLLFATAGCTITAALAATSLRLLEKPARIGGQRGNMWLRTKRALLIGLAGGCILAVLSWAVLIYFVTAGQWRRADSSWQGKQQELRANSGAHDEAAVWPFTITNHLS
jgi:peptidoglycan/LPS O-acetylase OafA/YrhL